MNKAEPLNSRGLHSKKSKLKGQRREEKIGPNNDHIWKYSIYTDETNISVHFILFLLYDEKISYKIGFIGSISNM